MAELKTSMLRVAIFTTRLESGGAFMAIRRTFEGLNKTKFKLKFISLDKDFYETNHLWKRGLEKLYREFIVKEDFHMSLSLSGLSSNYINEIIDNSDIIVLTWVNDGLLSLSNLERIISCGKPVFWRLSDVWPFTGGCHYPNGCNSFISDCRNCPGETKFFRWLSISNNINLQKKEFFSNAKNLTFLCPSEWILECARQSSCLAGLENINYDVIGTTVDSKIFNYSDLDKKGKYEEKLVVAFGARNFLSDRRKGFENFKKSIERIEIMSKNKIHVLFFGENLPRNFDFPCEYESFGLCPPKQVSTIFKMSDVFVSTTLEENLANTSIEALMCGCPVLAFDVGGYKDLGKLFNEVELVPNSNIDNLSLRLKRFVPLSAPAKQLLSKRAVNLYSKKSQNLKLENLFLSSFPGELKL